MPPTPPPVLDLDCRHFPISPPDLVEFLQLVFKQRGLTRKDLEPFIGSCARVAEVINRVRPLSREMIRRLSEGLNLSADVLVERDELRHAA